MDQLKYSKIVLLGRVWDDIVLSGQAPPPPKFRSGPPNLKIIYFKEKSILCYKMKA